MKNNKAETAKKIGENKNQQVAKKQDASIKIANNKIKPNSTTKKIVYLTFDDGPSVSVTDEILNVLKKHNVKATFFVNGPHDNNKLVYEKRLRRIVEDGHAIGNHGYTHAYDISYGSMGDFEDNVDKLEDCIEEITGIRTSLFRFQGGSSNAVHKKYLKDCTMKGLYKLINDSGYIYFDWNVSSGDSAMTTPPANRSVENILKGVKNKSKAIILMHDTEVKKHNAEALDIVITKLKGQGYSFDRLSKSSFVVHHRE